MMGFGKKNKSAPIGPDLPRWFLGREYCQPGLQHVHCLDSGLVAGIAPGHKKCVRSKVDGNEDALGLLGVGEGRILLLADSHFGSWAAEQALINFETVFQETEGSREARLFSTFLGLDDLLRKTKPAQEKPIQPGCATTLIAAWVENNTLAWCSIGDSSLWHIRSGRAKLEQEKTQNFLGDRQPLAGPLLEQLQAWGWLDPLIPPVEQRHLLWLISNLNRAVRGLDRDRVTVGQTKSELLKMLPSEAVDENQLVQPWQPLHLYAQAVLPEWGQRHLTPEDRLFLASDGVDEPASLVSTDVLLQLAGQSDGSLEDAMAQILEASHGRRGGGDNLACWLMEIL